MDLGPGLSVTVVGMGLVFFSLATLMVAIMLLDRLFPYREPVAAAAEGPVKAGQSASSNGTPSAPLAPPPAPRVAGPFEAVLGNQTHRVELRDLASRPMRVVVDGKEYQVERQDGATPQLLVDGRAYPARVVEAGAGYVTVGLEADLFRVELPAPVPAAVAAKPAAAPAAPVASAPPSDGVAITAPLPGKILKVAVAVGDRVTRGQEVCVIEAMKMENSIRAPQDGTVREVRTQQGQTVTPGEVLVVL